MILYGQQHCLLAIFYRKNDEERVDRYRKRLLVEGSADVFLLSWPSQYVIPKLCLY